MTYTINISCGTNSYVPIIDIRATDGAGTPIADAEGDRWLSVGHFEARYNPNGTPALVFTDAATRRTRSLTWADLDTVTPAVLFGGLPVTIASLYDVWSNIADLGLARL